jgi:hypothetical protein
VSFAKTAASLAAQGKKTYPEIAETLGAQLAFFISIWEKFILSLFE